MRPNIVIQSQVTLFFADRILRPDKLVSAIQEEISNQTPLILPVPDDSRFDNLPVVQFQSESSYSGNITRSSANLILAGQGRQDFKSVQENFVLEVGKFAGLILKNTLISRIGFVTDFFIEESNPLENVSSLINSNLRKIHVGTEQDVGLQYAVRGNILDNLVINNGTQIRIGRAQIFEAGVSNDYDGVLIKRDFNTVSTEDQSEILKEEYIKRLILNCTDLFALDDIQSCIWPPEGTI